MTSDRNASAGGEYIYHYLDKLSASFLRTALLMAGVDMPEPGPGEPLRYLELGFGQGMSLAIHAASGGGEYWGADILPEHVAHARTLIEAAGTKSTVLQKSFAELDAMSEAGELPQFNVVAMHGIWSWVSAEDRALIRNLIGRNLKPGGVVYSSYNSLPGWSFFQPIRDLMVSISMLYDEAAGNPVNVGEIIDYILAMAETEESVFLLKNPFTVKYLENLRNESPAYITHEFLGSTWDNFSFREISEEMEGIGCKFVTSAFVHHQSRGAIGPKAEEMIGEILDSGIRESLRDFAMNKKFRADCFVREPQRLSPDAQWRKIASSPLLLAKKRENIHLEVSFGYNPVPLQPEFFTPVLDRLAGAGGPLTVESAFGEMCSSPGGRVAVMEGLRVLIGINAVRFAVPEVGPETTEACRGLNRELCRQLFDNGNASIHFLASPVLGMGMQVAQPLMLLMHGRATGELDDAGWLEKAAGVLAKLSGMSPEAAMNHLRGLSANLDAELAFLSRYGIAWS